MSLKEEVLLFARDVLGEKNAEAWLAAPNPQFDGRAPVDMIDTTRGALRVLHVLDQMDLAAHGELGSQQPKP